ncbi:MAG: hypothetical protein MI741_12165, partial [Rhodospirillales bacterium]|nr:hypothetical protein [Rhodospirillales bacterium]
GDTEFLKNHALPFMEETALFFEDYLYEGPDGKYIFSPSTSPENFPSNTKAQGSINSTMDIAAARQLLMNLIEASKQLEVNADKIPMWEKMLTKLPDYMIDPELGVVKEWTTPLLDEALRHRHSSHLYALYDGMSSDIENDPEVREGFRKIVDHKLENHYKKAGFMSFGVVQLGQTATSLGEGELAYAAMVRLVNSYWLGNLASMHNHRSLFNMDISGGLPAVLIKMVVASRPGKVELLPALPSKWESGSVKGALCRGQIELKEIVWEKGRITATLRSGKQQTIELAVPGNIKMINVTDGEARIARMPDVDNARNVTLPEGKSVTFEIAFE